MVIMSIIAFPISYVSKKNQTVSTAPHLPRKLHPNKEEITVFLLLGFLDRLSSRSLQSHQESLIEFSVNKNSFQEQVQNNIRYLIHPLFEVEGCGCQHYIQVITQSALQVITSQPEI
mgnify:CR=1 FL=1